MSSAHLLGWLCTYMTLYLSSAESFGSLFFYVCLVIRLVIFTTFTVLFWTWVLGLLCLLLSCTFFSIRGLHVFSGLNLSMMTWQNFERFDIVKWSSFVKVLAYFRLMSHYCICRSGMWLFIEAWADKDVVRFIPNYLAVT